MCKCVRLIEFEDKHGLLVGYLGEIPDDMTTIFIVFGEDVDQEWIERELEILMIEEQFAQVPEILGVNRIAFRIDFEHGNRIQLRFISIDLIAWRMSQSTHVLHMPSQLGSRHVEVQTEIADMQHIDIMISLRVRRIVPRFTRELSDLHAFNRFHFRQLQMCLQRCFVHTYFKQYTS